MATASPVRRNDDGGVDLNSEVTFTAQYSGDHYVAAGAYLGSKGAYRLSVTESPGRHVPDDFTATRRTTGAVAVGGSATGEIDYGGDRDWFAVALNAGKTYRIELKGSRTGDGTLTDAGSTTRMAFASPVQGTTTAARAATAG